MAAMATAAAPGRQEASPWALRLLLLATLVLGIAMMHTLGHPAEHGPSHAPAAPTAMAATAATAPQAAPEATDPAPSDTGLDPASVCLAVLAASWTLALLITGHAARRLGGPLGAGAAGTRLAHALRPMPPPAGPPAGRLLLTRLSVLRT